MEKYKFEVIYSGGKIKRFNDFDKAFDFYSTLKKGCSIWETGENRELLERN